MNVQIVLFDGFDLLDAIAPYEVFTAAAKLATETKLSNLLNEATEKPNILLSTVCGGSLILAMDGLLEGRHAVTHHLGMNLLEAANAIPVHARVVDDGDLVTGGGVTSGLDVALYLVERELGSRIAHAVEQLFEYERRGTVWKAEGNTPKESKFENPIEATSHHSSIQSNERVNVQGKWDITISTPVGKLSVLLDLTTEDGRIAGTAMQGEDIVLLDNPVLEGNQLKWSMKVTKPMRLTLKFCVSVDGNDMYGEAKAGMLPSSKLIGQRIS